MTFGMQLFFYEYRIPAAVSQYSLTVRSCVYWMTEVSKIDKRFCVHFTAAALLYVACKISRNGLIDELKDILSKVLGRNSSQCCRVLSLRITAEMNTPELVELLQKSAIEHLTTFRQLVARDFCSVATIVTTDFEALYAYKRGDYQRCLHLSTQNVNPLWYARRAHSVTTYREFIQLMDDDIVSLTALVLIANSESRNDSDYSCVSQLTLSMYLMTQCQLKLHHSVTLLVEKLDYIEVAQRRHPQKRTLEHLTLKLVERKVTRRLDTKMYYQ